MLTEFLDLERWAQWFSSLDREFIFLLGLPFVVAIIGVWSAWSEEEESREAQPAEPRPAAETRAAERRRRVRRRGDVGAVAQHGSR
jgi:hypothetical protein